MKKKISCLLICALVLSSPIQSSFASTKPVVQSTQKTVAATPSNAEIKKLMTNFYTDALSVSGSGAPKYLSKSYPAYDNVLKMWQGIASGNSRDHIYKVVVTNVSLKAIVKKGDTFTYVMNTEGMVANPLVYSWEKGEYLVTVKYESKTLKIANIVAVPNKSVVSYDLRKSATFKNMIQQTSIFGEDYLKAVNLGLQPTVIDLLKPSSPFGLDIKSGTLVNNAIHSDNKTGNIVMTLTVPKEAQNIDYIELIPTSKNPNDIIKAACTTEKGETFSADVSQGAGLLYCFYGEKKVTIKFECASSVTIAAIKAHMSASVHAN